MAKKIRLSLRQEDVPCRYGGEEFVVILPNSDIAAAEKISRRLLANIESHVFKYDAVSEDIKLTISIEIACFPIHGSNWEELLKNADSALYHAKNNGRNQLHINAVL